MMAVTALPVILLHRSVTVPSHFSELQLMLEVMSSRYCNVILIGLGAAHNRKTNGECL